LIDLKRKIVRNYKDYGFEIFLKKAISYLLSPIYENAISFMYRIDINNVPEISAVHPNLRFMVLTPADSEPIAQIERMAEWLRGLLTSYLYQGKLCIIAYDQDQLIGFYIVSFKEIVIPRLSLKIGLADDEAWGEEIMINELYRGKGLASLLKLSVYEELRNRGIRELGTEVKITNRSSLKSASKFYLGQTYLVHYKKLPGYRRLIFSELENRKFITNDDIFAIKNHIKLHENRKIILRQNRIFSKYDSVKNNEYSFFISSSKLFDKSSTLNKNP
jgi:GNAT superfamily N-acetyltransferase